MMPNCPNCGKGIDHLTYSANEIIVAKFTKDGKYIDETHADVDGKSIEYNCPECSESLFRSEADAKKFLTGKQQEAKTDDP